MGGAIKLIGSQHPFKRAGVVAPAFTWPLTSDVNPSSGTPVQDRNFAKYNQLTAASGEVAAIDNIAITTNAFNWGIAGALMESNYSGLLANDADPVQNWIPTDASVILGAPEKADPFGADNAQSLVGDIGQGLLHTTGDIRSRHAYCGCWLKVPSGTGKALLTILTNDAVQQQYLLFDLSDVWQWCSFTALLDGTGAASGYIMIVPGDGATMSNEIYLRLPVYTLTAAGGPTYLTPRNGDGDGDILYVAAPAYEAGALAFYLEAAPLHHAEDGVLHMLFQITPFDQDDAGSYMRLDKLAQNELGITIYKGTAEQCKAAVTGVSYPTGAVAKIAGVLVSQDRYKLFLNGAELAATASPSLSFSGRHALAKFYVGSNGVDNGGHAIIRNIRVWWTTLPTDEYLQALTG